MSYSKIINDTFFNIPVTMHTRKSTFHFYGDDISYSDCFEKWSANVDAEMKLTHIF